MADKKDTVTSSKLFRTGTGRLMGMVLSAGSGSVLFTFYDNTAGSGTKIFEVSVSTSQVLVLLLPESYFVNFSTGLYLAIGAGGYATVWWREY